MKVKLPERVESVNFFKTCTLISNVRHSLLVGPSVVNISVIVKCNVQDISSVIVKCNVQDISSVIVKCNVQDISNVNRFLL